MAIDVVIETPVARPIEQVFAAVADVDGWPGWLIASGVLRVVRQAPGPLEAGAPLVIEQRAAGRASTVQARITALQPPVRFAVSGKDADGVAIDMDASLVALEPGVTGLRWQIRIGLPFRYRFFESMARPQVQRAAALDVEALRRRLESVPGH
jgi:uncharacterized protein YndB with AHSA1/START domain